MPSSTRVIPPHDLDVERSTLGACFHSVTAARAVAEEAGALFYTETHRAVHRALRTLAPTLDGLPPDGALVRNLMSEAGEAIDLVPFTDLVESGLLVGNVGPALVQLRELAARREEHAAAVMVQAAPPGGGAVPWDAVLARLEAARMLRVPRTPPGGADYIESISAFLVEADSPAPMIFPELLPCGVVMLLHGEPRARKSLAAFELALAAATGTAPFGLTRFAPAEPTTVLYVMEEDPRTLTRTRVRAMVHARCGDTMPDTLHVAVRRGVNLDDPVWTERLIADLLRLDASALVLDAARRLSAKTDEGPGKVRELIAVLRHIVTTAGVTIIIVHHDVKPPAIGQDQRRRSQRASGGDRFAACECPVHVERLNGRESLLFPEDYKFTADPAPFTFTAQVEDGLITSLRGTDSSTEDAEHAGVPGKIVEWLKKNTLATKSAMKKAGLGRWETIEAAVDALLKEGKVDAVAGRTAKSLRYFVPTEQSPSYGDASA